MPKLDFEFDDLDQFTPQVKEAILRMAKQQEEAEDRDRIPDRGMGEVKILSRTTDEEQKAKADLQRNPGGGIVMPVINDRDIRLPKQGGNS